VVNSSEIELSPLYLPKPNFSTFEEYFIHVCVTVAFYLASNNEIEASFIEQPLDEDPMLFVLSLAA